jgi:hypothetical protein
MFQLQQMSHSEQYTLSVAAHTGKMYHLAEPGALSEAVRPLKPDGNVDADVMGRLSVRHDDSMQNVANRLTLWDRQVSASGIYKADSLQHVSLFCWVATSQHTGPAAHSKRFAPLGVTAITAVLRSAHPRLQHEHTITLEPGACTLSLLQVQGLRAAYEDVTLRVPAAGNPAAIHAQAESFVQLEAILPSSPDAVGPTSVWPLIESWQLEELSYRVVSTVR